jgi:hypothetical protein
MVWPWLRWGAELIAMPLALTQHTAPKVAGRARRRVSAAKRVEWMLREVRCMAAPGAERETLERLFQQELERMRAVGKSRDMIAEFQAAAAVHITLRRETL